MGNSHPSVDKEGFLTDLSDWDKDAAVWLAASEEIQLGAEHWEIIETLRDFYARTQTAPAMRPFVKIMREALPDRDITSIYLMQRFGQSPAKTAAKISGLPKPANCL